MANNNFGKGVDELVKEANEQPKVKYYKHPEVDGVWHDTGKTEERYGSKYKIFENESGGQWGITDDFLKKFQEVAEPRHPFKLDKEKYPDVEETPYGFIYNVGGHSITDQNAFNKMRGIDDEKDYGWTITEDGDELFMPSFEEAYKYAKRGK